MAETKHDRLVQAAKDAIDRVMQDDSVTPSKTQGSLEELSEWAAGLAEAIGDAPE